MLDTLHPVESRPAHELGEAAGAIVLINRAVTKARATRVIAAEPLVQPVRVEGIGPTLARKPAASSNSSSTPS